MSSLHTLHLLSAQESKDLLPSCPASAQEEQTHSIVQQPVTSVSSSGQTEAVVLRYAAHVNGCSVAKTVADILQDGSNDCASFPLRGR